MILLESDGVKSSIFKIFILQDIACNSCIFSKEDVEKMKNKVKRNLILALTIGGIATIPNFVFANTALNTPGTVTDLGV